MIQTDVHPVDYYSLQFPGARLRGTRAKVCCCFHGERTPSLLLNLDDGCFKCFGCQVRGDMVDFHSMRYGLTFKEAMAELCRKDWRSHSTAPMVSAKQRKTVSPESIQAIWEGGSTIEAHDPAGLYLSSRGLTLSHYPAVLRYHAALPYYDPDRQLLGRFPAMIAAIQSQDGACIAIHRTYLTRDGGKLDPGNGLPARKMTGATIEGGLRGSAVRLGCAGREIAVGEGIESCLAYSILFGVPAWSALTSWGMAEAWVPPDVETVHLVIDNDDAGRKAADALETRLIQEGKSVIRKPLPSALVSKKGADWNDGLQLEKICEHSH